MKRIVTLLLVTLTVLSMFVGCEKDLKKEELGGNNDNKTTTSTKPTEKKEEDSDSVNLSEEQLAYLEECGISLEAFEAMDPEQQRALLKELGIVAGDKEEGEEKPKPEKPKEYTTEDVAQGGRFVVRIGDGLWNNYYLYYEDGVLVKVTASFRKNDLEPEENYVWEGDTLSEFWYYDKTLDELIEYFKEQDYGYTTTITKL